MSDLEEALISIVSGKIEALQTLYKELCVPVFRLALSILRNKSWAEEAMKDTFVRVYEKANSYRPGTNPKTWLILIARNLSYDLLRSNKFRCEDVEKSLKLWEEAIQLDPECLDCILARASLLEREQRLQEAAQEWRFAIEWLKNRGFFTDGPKAQLQRIEEKLNSDQQV